MKKITVILLALFLVCSVSALSFAKTSHATGEKKAEATTEVVRGKIISIDVTNNQIVVKENKTDLEKTITVEPKVISTLKVDDGVKVTLKAGTNVAERVKKLKKCATTKK